MTLRMPITTLLCISYSLLALTSPSQSSSSSSSSISSSSMASSQSYASTSTTVVSGSNIATSKRNSSSLNLLKRHDEYDVTCVEDLSHTLVSDRTISACITKGVGMTNVAGFSNDRKEKEVNDRVKKVKERINKKMSLIRGSAKKSDKNKTDEKDYCDSTNTQQDDIEAGQEDSNISRKASTVKHKDAAIVMEADSKVKSGFLANAKDSAKETPENVSKESKDITKSDKKATVENACTSNFYCHAPVPVEDKSPSSSSSGKTTQNALRYPPKKGPLALISALVVTRHGDRTPLRRITQDEQQQSLNGKSNGGSADWPNTVANGALTDHLLEQQWMQSRLGNARPQQMVSPTSGSEASDAMSPRSVHSDTLKDSIGSLSSSVDASLDSVGSPKDNAGTPKENAASPKPAPDDSLGEAQRSNDGTGKVDALVSDGGPGMLTTRGWNQLKDVGKALAKLYKQRLFNGLPVDVSDVEFYSTPSPRTVLSAAALALGLGLKVEGKTYGEGKGPVVRINLISVAKRDDVGAAQDAPFKGPMAASSKGSLRGGKPDNRRFKAERGKTEGREWTWYGEECPKLSRMHEAILKENASFEEYRRQMVALSAPLASKWTVTTSLRDLHRSKSMSFLQAGGNPTWMRFDTDCTLFSDLADIFRCRSCHNLLSDGSVHSAGSQTQDSKSTGSEFCELSNRVHAFFEREARSPTPLQGMSKTDFVRTPDLVSMRAGPLLADMFSGWAYGALPKLSVLSAHDTTVTLLLAALAPERALDWVPYASTLIFELWRGENRDLGEEGSIKDGPGGDMSDAEDEFDANNRMENDNHYVRMVYNGEPIEMPWCEERKGSLLAAAGAHTVPHMCPLRLFMRHVGTMVPLNRREQCA